jgi:hypothetical protein
MVPVGIAGVAPGIGVVPGTVVGVAPGTVVVVVVVPGTGVAPGMVVDFWLPSRGVTGTNKNSATSVIPLTCTCTILRNKWAKALQTNTTRKQGRKKTAPFFSS